MSSIWKSKDIEEYSSIEFYHEPTDHEGIVYKIGEICSYYYLESDPRWHHEITSFEIANRFNSEYWIFKSGERSRI